MDFMANVLIIKHYIISLFAIIASIYLCILILDLLRREEEFEILFNLFDKEFDK